MKPKKIGAPTKADGGMQKVLFIRAPHDLVEALDRMVEREKKARPGRGLSRSDLARDLLYQAVRRDGHEHPST